MFKARPCLVHTQKKGNIVGLCTGWSCAQVDVEESCRFCGYRHYFLLASFRMSKLLSWVKSGEGTLVSSSKMLGDCNAENAKHCDGGYLVYGEVC